MIWQSASEFWAMGGYGMYVWGSLGVTVVLLALELLLTRMGRQQALEAVCEAMAARTDDAPNAMQQGASRASIVSTGAPS